jgi:hypothetical protein
MSSSTTSDDDSEDHETGQSAAHIGLHLVLVMRHMLIKAQLLSQIQGHGATDVVQFAHKSTQTEFAWPQAAIERQQPCLVHQQQTTYTWNEMRLAVNNERAKSRLRVEISALKERCVMLEKLCTDKGFFVPSRS